MCVGGGGGVQGAKIFVNDQSGSFVRLWLNVLKSCVRQCHTLQPGCELRYTSKPKSQLCAATFF